MRLAECNKHVKRGEVGAISKEGRGYLILLFIYPPGATAWGLSSGGPCGELHKKNCGWAPQNPPRGRGNLVSPSHSGKALGDPLLSPAVTHPKHQVHYFT